jgi:ATP-binding cassette subfamily B (MDR/TAP) protein 1
MANWSSSNSRHEGCQDSGDSTIRSSTARFVDTPPSYELQSIQTSPQVEQPNLSWRFLFAFTTPQHLPTLICALFFSILGGLIKPTASICIGRVFYAQIRFGAGDLNSEGLIYEAAKWSIALTVLGVVAWLVEAVFLGIWIVFGELQAKAVRGKIFSSMLDKEIEWYDLRVEGVAPLLARIAT